MIFFTALVYLVFSAGYETRVLSMVTSLLIADTQHREHVDAAIIASLRRILRFTIKLPTFHILTIWFSYSFFGISAGLGGCAWGLLSGLATVLALLPGWFFALPGVAELWLSGSPLLAVVFLLGHILITSHLDPLMLNEPVPVLKGSERTVDDYFSEIPQYVLGLSIYGGWYVMAAWEGVVLGPLILSLLVIIGKELQQGFRLTPEPPAFDFGEDGEEGDGEGEVGEEDQVLQKATTNKQKAAGHR
jgi:hypothetical protein